MLNKIANPHFNAVKEEIVSARKSLAAHTITNRQDGSRPNGCPAYTSLAEVVQRPMFAVFSKSAPVRPHDDRALTDAVRLLNNCELELKSAEAQEKSKNAAAGAQGAANAFGFAGGFGGFDDDYDVVPDYDDYFLDADDVGQAFPAGSLSSFPAGSAGWTTASPGTGFGSNFGFAAPAKFASTTDFASASAGGFGNPSTSFAGFTGPGAKLIAHIPLTASSTYDTQDFEDIANDLIMMPLGVVEPSSVPVFTNLDFGEPGEEALTSLSELTKACLRRGEPRSFDCFSSSSCPSPRANAVRHGARSATS